MKIKKWLSKKENLVGAIIIILYFTLNLLIINDYGFTADSIENLQMGEDTLHFLTTGESVNTFVAGGANMHGPWADAWGAIDNKIYNEKLHILDYTAANYLHLIVLGTLLIMIVYFFALKELGFKEAIFSSIFLILFPRLFADFHNNPKDPVITFGYTISIIFFYYAFTRNTWKWWIFAGIALGISFATKINSLFIAVIIGLWAVAVYALSMNIDLGKGKIAFKKIKVPWPKIGAFVFAAITFFFLFRPYLWKNTIEGLKLVGFYFTQDLSGWTERYMGQVFQSTVNLPWHYAIVMLILVTPLVTLFFLLIGLGVSSRKVVKGRDILFILLLIWFIIPWGKYALAAFINHRIPIWNGIRHFLEVAVPLSIIAGIGAAFLFDRLYQWLDNFESLKKKNTAKNIALILIFLLAISPTIVAMAKIHPYQTSYYNSILGGPKGVYDKNVWARIDYWGAPYRQGAEWLNQNAYKGSTLFFTDTSMYERIASFYVSKDFQVVNNVSQSNYLVTQYPFPGANPIHTIDALGAPILLVYRVQ